MRKSVVQIGAAVLSAIYNIGSLIADARDWLPNTPWQYHAIVGFMLFAGVMVWIALDKQNQINIANGGVRLVPIPRDIVSSDDGYTKFVIDLEIWTARDIHTDNIILNLVGARTGILAIPRWKIWELLERTILDFPFSKPIVGLRTENGQYRVSIKHSTEQPFKDTVTFILPSDAVENILCFSNVVMMELVLITGIPKNTYRQYLRKDFLKKETTKPV